MTLAVSRDSKWAANGYQDGKIIVWTISRPTEVYVQWDTESTVHALAFSPKGDCLASVHKDGSIQIFSVTGSKHNHSGKEEKMKLKEGPEKLYPSPTGPTDHSPTDPTVDEDQCCNSKSPIPPLCAVDWAPNGLRIAACSEEFLYIWDVNTLEHDFKFSKPTEAIPHPGLTFVTFSPDSRLLAYGGARNQYYVRDFERNRVRAAPQCIWEPEFERTIIDAALDAKGEHLIALSDDNTVRIWDIRGRHTLKMQYTMPDGKVLAISFSPGGTAMLVASHGNHRQAFFSEWHVAVSPKN